MLSQEKVILQHVCRIMDLLDNYVMMHRNTLTLEMIQQKGDKASIDALAAVLIENPDPPLIEKHPEDQQ